MGPRPISSIETTREFYKGNDIESVVAYVLRRENYYVIILADYRERKQNGAPGARSNAGFITLPDLDIGKMGYRAFAEVKFKKGPSYTTATGIKDHGIGLRSWEMYLKASEQFGVETFIFIYEGTSGALLFNSISNLTPSGKSYGVKRCGTTSYYYSDRSDKNPRFRIYNGGKMNPGGMIFFPRASFGLWGKIALLGDEIFKQLNFDDLANIKVIEKGDKIFNVLRHPRGQ